MEGERMLLPVVFVFLATGMLASAQGVVSVGSRLEPFVDDYLIEKMDGVELRLQHPVIREEVIRFDAPWEGPTSAYVTIFKDENRYRMYYRGGSSDDGSELTCTAESPDCIHWSRPKLGLFEVGSTKYNNVIWVGKGAHALTPFKDTNPGAQAGEEYKAVSPGDGGGRSVLYAFASSDGYGWRRLREDPIITEGAFDSQNLAFWDTERGEYVCYFRDFRDGKRTVKRSTSRDFRTWSKPEWVTFNPPVEQYYTNTILQYPRAPHIYVGFPKRFVPERKAVASHQYGGVSDGVFISSRDGLSFHKWSEAFYRPGLDEQNWTDRNNMAAWGIFELTPGEISIFYSSHYRHPTNRMVRATVRTDGFASLHADTKGGQVVTKPITFEGIELLLNYSTSAVGGVQVEVQDEDGTAISRFELDECPVIYGDQIERVVKWNSGSDVSSLAGKPVKLRFRLSDADLYSIRFR